MSPSRSRNSGHKSDGIPPLEWLNYHHLLYFWLVAKEGGITQAAARLRLSHPTVSTQIHVLEDTLGEKLFEKRGRRLVLTEMGRLVFRYADEIFALGRELLDTVKGRPTGQPIRLAVGITDSVPKLIARALLAPADEMPERVRIVCREAHSERLLIELAEHELDLVISDAPAPHGAPVRAYNHLLGHSATSVMGAPDLVARYRRGFPESLDGAPFLLPTDDAPLRRSVDQWFERKSIRPQVIGEFEDSALLKSFAQSGAGLFFTANVIEKETERQYDVKILGRVEEIREQFFAITVERRLRHPVVVAICDAARHQLFAGSASRD